MAYTTAFLSRNPLGVLPHNHFTPTDGVLPTLRRQGLKPRTIQIINILRFDNTRKNMLKKRYLSLIPTLAAESDSIPVAPSHSDVIKKFYTFINDKNLTQLEGLLSKECFLEDSIFPNSFQGKKEVMNFISQLVESMGENVHFRIGTVCEGDELTASLDWHLEWKDDQIPFSRGCSIFQCAIENDRLVIRKAKIITESPIKPGKLALGLLKILASLFDEFPKAAKWFLKSPQTIFKVVSNIYKLFFAPIMTPILTFYITLWKLIVRLLGYIISILHIIGRFLNKNSSNGDPDNSDLKTD